jgi:hypothetical protein
VPRAAAPEKGRAVLAEACLMPRAVRVRHAKKAAAGGACAAAVARGGRGGGAGRRARAAAGHAPGRRRARLLPAAHDAPLQARGSGTSEERAAAAAGLVEEGLGK